LASEIIHQKLLEIKKKKPVYVSISDTAASGGYYIATAGNKIFANENSITGSIGVVTMSFNLKGLFEKVGLNYENLEFGKTLDFSNISQSPEKYELELIEESMISVYEEFKSRVGSGRKIDIETVESLAKGQIYTGIEAKNNKLVDQIGGLNQTISYLAKDLKLNNYEVIVYRKDFNTWDQMTNLSYFYCLFLHRIQCLYLTFEKF
jgi:protease-4